MLDSETLTQVSDGTDESIVSNPASPIFDIDPNQYTSAHRRTSSAWSFHSMLTAFTTPTSSKRPSRRTSWIGSTKAITPYLTSKPLPQLILTRILRHLRALHEDPKSATCSACFNRNAFNLALVNRAWNHAVRDELYRIIHIDGLEQLSKGRNAKANKRLKLLYRTLQSRPALARNVQELRIWNPQVTLSEATTSQIASIIVLCPNLKLFDGSQPFYNHEKSSLHQALSTRVQLKSHLWIVSSSMKPTHGHGDFILLHAQWQNMTTLALRCQRDATLDRKCFASLTQCLPALEKLSISGFDADSFDDACLLGLKSLKALRLADLSGISDQGLSRFASSPIAQSLASLSLVGVNMVSLYTVVRLLARLPLEKFTLAQYRTLSLPASDVVIQPLLASSTMIYMHWDIPLEKAASSTATTHLISSIQYGGFPLLRTLRCPTDTPTGDLQALCQPLPLTDHNLFPPSSQISGTTLRATRLRAEARASAGRSGESQFGTTIKIIITDPEGIIQHESQASWLGYVGYDRRIQYSLTSDLGSYEQRRCLAEEGDMLGDVFHSAGTGCRGTAVGRQHIERQRWTGGDLDRLF